MIKVFEQLTAPPILEMCFLENVSYIMQNAYQKINFLAKFQAELSKMVRDTKGINYSLLYNTDRKVSYFLSSTLIGFYSTCSMLDKKY